MLGIMLDLRSTTLDVIAYEYKGSQECCTKMLERWLTIDPKPSWGKLLETIESLPLNNPDFVKSFVK